MAQNLATLGDVILIQLTIAFESLDHFLDGSQMSQAQRFLDAHVNQGVNACLLLQPLLQLVQLVDGL